jgi:ABC-type multidrug transport system ATPase subunit
MCQQVIIIDRGKIKANKPTDKLHTVLEINKEVVEVEFEKPVLEKDLLSITGVLTATSKTEQVWWIESSAEKDVRAALFKWAVEKNNAVLTLKKMEKTLEEIFQEVTQNK